MSVEASIHHEQPMSPDVKKSRYDALLVHGYWLTEKRGKTALALRSRLATRAAALLYKEGRVGKIFLGAGKLWGDGYQSVGELMRQELETIYGIPHEDIITEDKAYSTGGEVKRFLQHARENGWTNLLDVAFDQHLRTIPDAFRQYKGKASFESVEQIIKDSKPNSHVLNLLDRLANSEFEADFATYESILLLGLKIPILNKTFFSYDRLEVKNRKTRTERGKDTSLPIDVYRINGERVEPSERAMQIGRRVWPVAVKVKIGPKIRIPKAA